MKYYVVQLTGSWYMSKDETWLNETARDYEYKSSLYTSCEKYIDNNNGYYNKLVIVNEDGHQVEMDDFNNIVIALHPFVCSRK